MICFDGRAAEGFLTAEHLYVTHMVDGAGSEHAASFRYHPQRVMLVLLQGHAAAFLRADGACDEVIGNVVAARRADHDSPRACTKAVQRADNLGKSGDSKPK